MVPVSTRTRAGNGVDSASVVGVGPSIATCGTCSMPGGGAVRACTEDVDIARVSITQSARPCDVGLRVDGAASAADEAHDEVDRVLAARGSFSLHCFPHGVGNVGEEVSSQEATKVPASGLAMVQGLLQLRAQLLGCVGV